MAFAFRTTPRRATSGKRSLLQVGSRAIAVERNSAGVAIVRAAFTTAGVEHHDGRLRARVADPNPKSWRNVT
jgi:hypothetical protein